MIRGPLVSIIMPTYNCDKYIGESINSVLQQTYPNWELIVIDDNSQDATELIVRGFQEKCNKIIYHKLLINSGAAIARNTGINFANGKYIAFLDSDDLWLNKKLENQISFMEINNYKFSYTKYLKINENGERLGKAINSIPKVTYKKMLFQNYIGNSSAIYNCESLGKIYAPNIRKRNDYALWLKILRVEKEAYRYDEILMKYRITANSISRNKVSLLKYQWQLYHDIEEISFVNSIFYISNNIIIKLFKIK